jgi:hypothetical protein
MKLPNPSAGLLPDFEDKASHRLALFASISSATLTASRKASARDFALHSKLCSARSFLTISNLNLLMTISRYVSFKLNDTGRGKVVGAAPLIKDNEVGGTFKVNYRLNKPEESHRVLLLLFGQLTPEVDWWFLR